MTALYRAEDEAALIRAFLPESSGTVVEVGANDPIGLSQSYEFERRGWHCVLVEPHPVYAERLRQVRSGKVFEFACGAPEDAGRKVTLFMSGGESSVSLDLMQPHGLGRVTGSVEVEVRTLDGILEEAGVTRVDLLSIDVEGYELSVLKGFDLARFQPRLVLLEDMLYDLSKHRHMLERGYALFRRTGSNSWYLPAAAVSLSALDRMLLWRKYYLGTPLRNLRHRYHMWKARRRSP